MKKNIEKELSSEETLEKKLNVTLRKNTLDKENESYYASVNSQTANVKVALGNIKDEDKGIEISGLKRGLELYNKQVIKLLSQGFSVKVMDLGVLRIKHRGKLNSSGQSENRKSGFTVEFEVAEEVLNAVQNLDVDEIVRINKAPILEEIVDLSRQVSDGKVTNGKPVAIKGRNLKVNKENDEIYFVPQSSDETDDSDKSNWLKVDSDKIFRNKPSELNLFLPEGLKIGTKYKVLIRSLCFASGAERKTKLTGKSEAFELA